MCPLLCRPLCCQIMAQAPISKPGLLLFPKQVRQEGGSGQSLRLGGKVQILAPGFFPLGLLMARLYHPLSPFPETQGYLVSSPLCPGCLLEGCHILQLHSLEGALPLL